MNGVHFVQWDEVELMFKNRVEAILKIHDDDQRTLVDVFQRRAQKVIQKTASALSEADLTIAIAATVFSDINPKFSPLEQVHNENFTCDTRPCGRPDHIRPDRWFGIPHPRTDMTLGYRLDEGIINAMVDLDGIFDGQALNTTKRIFCGQVAVEYKLSAKGSTIAVAMDQAASATATMSNAIGQLVDAAAAAAAPPLREIDPPVDSLNPSISPHDHDHDHDQDRNCEVGVDVDPVPPCLQECLVFGVVLDEYVAYLTVTWRSRPGKFRFAKVAAHALFLESETLIFVRRVEAVKRWMERRRALILSMMDDIRKAVRRASERAARVAFCLHVSSHAA